MDKVSVHREKITDVDMCDRKDMKSKGIKSVSACQDLFSDSSSSRGSPNLVENGMLLYWLLV